MTTHFIDHGDTRNQLKHITAPDWAKAIARCEAA